MFGSHEMMYEPAYSLKDVASVIISYKDKQDYLYSKVYRADDLTQEEMNKMWVEEHDILMAKEADNYEI